MNQRMNIVVNGLWRESGIIWCVNGDLCFIFLGDEFMSKNCQGHNGGFIPFIDIFYFESTLIGMDRFDYRPNPHAD